MNKEQKGGIFGYNISEKLKNLFSKKDNVPSTPVMNEPSQNNSITQQVIEEKKIQEQKLEEQKEKEKIRGSCIEKCNQEFKGDNILLGGKRSRSIKKKNLKKKNPKKKTNKSKKTKK
jgi:hypothetical protein